MISVIVYGHSEKLSDAVSHYLQEHSDFRVVEYSDKLEAAVPATLAIMPELVICEVTPELDPRSLMAATRGYITGTYFLVCGVRRDYDELLDLLRFGARDCISEDWDEDALWQGLDRFYMRYQSKANIQEDAHSQKLRRVLDKKFFEDTIVTSNGKAILSDFEAINYEYQISFQPGWFHALYMLIDPRPREVLYADAFLPVFQLEALAKQFFSTHCHSVVCYVKDHGLSVLLNTRQEISGFKALIRQFLSLCTRECKWLSGANTLSVGVGLGTNQSEDIPKLMQSAKMAGWMRLSAGFGRILSYGDYYDRYYDKDEFLSTQAEAALRRSVEQLDPAGCRDIIREQLQGAENAATGISVALDINDVLIDAFNTCGKQTVVESSKYLQLAQNMPPMVENLDTMAEIQDAILSWAQKCMLLLREQNADQEDKDIFAAKQYIAANYTSPIRLEDVSAVVNLSTPYFCMKFRQSTGKTFIEYLTELRVNRAKELLCSSNKKVYEIAQMVGFQDSRHFSRTFQKCCGMLPRAYRETKAAARRQTYEGRNTPI